MKPVLILTATLFAASASAAFSASSDWFEMEGARIRLVTTGEPDAQGLLKGTLDIALKPGWKTYWRDPGDAGVPPMIDVPANVLDAELSFPAPQRHDEGDFQWAGYDYPLGLPVTFTIKGAAALQPITADVFLGVCEAICVPVQARLSVDPGQGPENAGDKALVEAAFNAIPKPATEEFGVKVVSKPGDTDVLLEAAFPGNPDTAELFLAGGDGYSFTTPVRTIRNGKTYFETIVSLPARLGTGPGLHYTLVTDTGAVNGLLPYF